MVGKFNKTVVAAACAVAVLMPAMPASAAGPLVELHVYPDHAPRFAGEVVSFNASGRDADGEFVTDISLTALAATAVPGGGGSDASVDCNADAMTCVITDTGLYKITGSAGDVDGEYWNAFEVLASDAVQAEIDMTTTKATVTYDYRPITVTVTDMYGNPVMDDWNVSATLETTRSGLGSFAGGPHFFPASGLTRDGQVVIGYDAGPLPGTDDLVLTITRVWWEPRSVSVEKSIAVTLL